MTNLRSLATTANILLLLAPSPAVVHSFNIHDFLDKDNNKFDDTIQHLRGSFGGGFDTSCVTATDERTCTTTKDGSDSQNCVWCGVGGTYGACVSSDQASTFGKWMKCGGGGDKPDDDDKKENDIWGCIMATDDADCATKKNCTWCTDAENQSGYGMCFTPDIAAMATDKFGQFVKCGTEKDNDSDKKPSSVSFAARLMDDDDKDKDDADKSGIFDCLTATDDSDCATKKCSWCTDAKDETGYGVCLTEDAASMAMEKLSQFVKCDTSVKGRNNRADEIKDTIKARFAARKERARAHFKQWVKSSTIKAKENNAWVQSFDNFDTTCLMSKSAETCTSTKDKNGDDCVWCDAMGTFGLCLSKDESTMAGNWMKCGNNNDEEMQDDNDDDKKGGGILDCVQAKDTSDCATKKCTWCTDAKDETGVGMCLTDDIASKATDMFGQYVKCETKTEKKKPEEKQDVQAAAPQFDLQCMEQGGQDKTTCESTKDSEQNQPCKWCKAYHVLNVCVSADEASEGSTFLECDDTTNSVEETEEEEEKEDEVQEEDELKFDLQCIKEQDKTSCESTNDSEQNKPCKWCKAFKVENVCVSADEASEGSSFLECDDDNSVMTEE